MKKIIILACILTGFAACNNSDKNGSGSSDNEIDAARNFVRAALDGDYNLAQTFMVDDSLNKDDLNAIKRMSERLTAEEKKEYKGASIRIHESRAVNDSTHLIFYSNSYTNKKDSLKVIKSNDKWLVDFKYIFKHKVDSLP